MIPPAPEPDITVKYGVMLGLPDGNGGSAAFSKADIAPLDIAAFRRHLQRFVIHCVQEQAFLGLAGNNRGTGFAATGPRAQVVGAPVACGAP